MSSYYSSTAVQNGIKPNYPLQKIINIIFFLMFFSQIAIPKIASISISSIMVALCLLISLPFSISIVLQKVVLNRDIACVAGGFAILILIQLVGIVLNINSRAFVTVFQTLLIMFFFILTSSIDYERLRTKSFNILYGFYSVTVFLSYLFTAGKVGVFSIIASKNTSSGIFVFLTLINVLFVLTHKSKKTMLIFSLLLIYPLLHLQSRISIGLLVIIPTLYFLLTINPAKKHTRNIIIAALIVVIAFIVYIYPKLLDWEYYQRVNNWSQIAFGKNLQNERANIWSAVLTATRSDWLFGLGTGTVIFDIYRFQGSCHNQYVQLILQNGLLGVAAFVYILWRIWLIISINIQNKISRYSCACFLALMFYNCYETTLLQNKLESGIIQWMLIGLCISYSRMIDTKKQMKGDCNDKTSCEKNIA